MPFPPLLTVVASSWMLGAVGILSIAILLCLLAIVCWRTMQRNYQALQERTLELQLTLGAANIGLWRRNLVTDEMTASPELEQIFNVTPGSFSTNPHLLEEMCHPEDLAKTLEVLARAAKARIAYQDECRIIWPDGTVRWLEVRGKTFCDESGKPIQAVGTVVDITERKLQQQVLDREQVLTGITQRIRSSLDLSEILNTTVQEVRQFLQTDRVIILQLDAQWIAHVLVESVDPQWLSIAGSEIHDPCVGEKYVEPFRQGLVTAKSDIYVDVANACHRELLASFQVRASLVVPILQEDHLWGLLIVHHCAEPRDWQRAEIDLLQQLAAKLGIAIQQADLLAKLQRELQSKAAIEAALLEAKIDLEKRVAKRTIKLQEFAAELQDLYNNAPCGYHSLDADGRYLLVNDTELSWLGYQRADLIGRPFSEFLSPSGKIIFQDNFEAFKAQGHIDNLEFEMVCQDGSILPMSLSATVAKNAEDNFLMTRSTIVNISDRKIAQAEQQESARRWHTLLNNVQMVVVGLDRSGNVEYVNPFFLKLTNYREEEVLGRNWFENFLPDKDNFFGHASFSELLEQDFHSYYENSIRTKNGGQRVIAWNNILLHNVNGTIAGRMSIGEDITKRQEVDRLKSEFVSTVSHELRTPLTAIRGSLGLLAAGVYNNKPEKNQQMLKIAAEQTDRLVRLVNDILDLQRLESGQVALVRQSCQAWILIQQSVEIMQASADVSGIQICIEGEDVTIWAYPDAILQTFTNLIGNAIKFSPPGSQVWLRAERQGSAVLFSVQDRGRGIPTDRLETIFERFQQVDASDSRQKGGTGLGLAICRHIVEQHGGRIWAESTLEEGSTFYFTVPASIENTGAL
jgi:PAS domain S-box-containing protein